MSDIRSYKIVTLYDPTGLVIEYRMPDDMPFMVHPTFHFGNPCWKPVGRLGVTAPTLEVWPIPKWWPGYEELMAQVELYDTNPDVSYDWGRVSGE